MLISRASVRARIFATAVLAAIVGGLVVVPAASAVEAPTASVFAIQTNGPSGLVTLGDWYTSNAVGAGGGYHYVRFTVPCGWPAGSPIYVDLFSPEMNRVSGALAQSEEPNGTYDSTQFELYGPGVTVGPGYASPGPGTGIAGTRTTFQPGGVGVAEAWMRYATLAAPVTCGNYVVRSQVLAGDLSNPTGGDDDQNGWRIRVGTDADADPTNAPLANYDNPDGLVGTNDEITLGLDQVSFQQDSGALACQTFFEYVSPGQASIDFHNFDMDGNTRVRYYAPSDATYDPNANSGGVLGTLSTNGQWNGGTLATRVGDTIVNPESGWWRFVTCISTQNQFIQEGEAGRAAYYSQPPTPTVTIAKSDGLATVAPGQTITYTIDVNNVAVGATAGAANNVVVHDLLPAGVTYQSCASPVPAQGSWACSESGGNVTFTQNGWINAGAAAQLTVTARVNQGVSGSIVNNATVDYTDQIGNPFLQVTASDTDTIAPLADLSIVKSDSPDPVAVGATLTYTLLVTNAGPSDATTVSVVDTLPAGVTFGTATPTQGSCGQAAGVVTCALGTITAGAAATITITVTPTAAGTISNTATVSSAIPDPVPGNDSDTELTTVIAAADLSIVKSDSTDPVDPGDSFFYTLTVTNNGPSDASSLTVSDTVPAGFTVTSVTSGLGSCGHIGNVVNCTLATLPLSASWVITVNVDVDLAAGGGLYTDTATVTSTSSDPVPGNNSDSEGTIVTPAGDLALTKTDGVASVVAGTSTTYTITLTNNGPSTVPAGVVVSDTIPANTIGSESEANCVIAAAFTCATTAALAPGASVSYQLTLAVSPGFPGAVLSNTASIASSPIPDPFSANNSATDTDSVSGSADLALTKSDGVASVVAGTSTTYTITLTNNGPSTVPAGVVVSDTIPAGTNGSESEASCVIGAVFTCATTAALAPGASVSYQLTLAVPANYAGANVVNTASITSSPTPDPTPANDSATDTDTVTTSADLSIVKTGSVPVVDPVDSFSYTLTVTNNGPSDASSLTVSDTVPAGFTVTGVTSGSGSCGYAGNVVTCTLASLPFGGAPWVIIVSVDVGLLTGGGLYTDTATVSATTADPVPGNNSDSEGTIVPPAADLSIVKSDSPDPVAVGATLTYTLLVTNAGPSDATTVSVVDTLPAGVTFGTATPTQGSCGQAAGVVTCALGTITAGAAATITITVTPTAAGTISNTATVSSAIPDPVPGNDSDTELTTVTAAADLSIVKSDSPDPVAVGATLTYTLLVTNAGPSDATTVSVVDTLPAGVTFGTATPTQGSCGQAAGVVTCALGTITAGAAATITITVTPTAAGTISNTATVSSAIPDPVPGNDSDTELTTVTAAADLSIVKSDSPDPVAVGATLTYTLLVTNAGPSDATTVSVVDTLPAGVTFGTATPTQGSCGQAAGVVTCALGTITAGAAATITITVTPTAAGTISNTATVSSAIPDPVPGNDSDTELTTVTAAADLSIVKSDGVISVRPGTSTTYTITLTNNGPSDVPAGVVVTDPIPSGTIASEYEPNCVLVGTIFTCTTTATLVSGASVVYQLTLAIDVAYMPTTLVNTATITVSPVPDPNPANDTSSDADTVTPLDADLSIVKTDSADPVMPGDSFSYTIVVTNAGPDDARVVGLTDTVPGVLTILAVTSSGTGVCLTTGNAIVCGIDPLVAGATWTVTVQVGVPLGTPSGTVTNTATVSGTGDTDLTNDSASQITTIGELVGSADLTVTKTVDDAKPAEGDTLTYVVTVTNGGPDDATGVEITDVLPTGLTFVSSTASQGSYKSASGIWTVGSLAVGETAGLQIRAMVDDGTAGTTLTNRALVSAVDQGDPTPSDDDATAPVVVAAEAAGGGPGGGTAFTGFPGAAVIAWMFGLAMLGLFALALGTRRRVIVEPPGEDRRNDTRRSGRFRDAPDPFTFFKRED